MQKVLSKREKNIFIITIGVIIFAVIFNFGILPIMNKNDNSNKEISALRLKLNKYQWLLAQKANIEAKYAKFTSSGTSLELEQNPVVGALADLERIAKDSGVQITDMRPQAGAQNSAKYHELLIDLRLEGALENYIKFFYGLENSLSLIKVKRFQLQAKANSQLLDSNLTVSQPQLLEK